MKSKVKIIDAHMYSSSKLMAIYVGVLLFLFAFVPWQDCGVIFVGLFIHAVVHAATQINSLRSELELCKFIHNRVMI